ncbi:MAG: Hsp70 family protein, partial [Oscillospiraceae bacterium]|nr:Hsp70 family protein [Oscillospiraceae bacterium]
EISAEDALSDLSGYIDKTIRKKSVDTNSEAVISIPYTYTKRRKNILLNTFSRNGIKVLASVDSPVAIILGFGILDKEFKSKTLVLVDIGEKEYRVYLMKLKRDNEKNTIIDIIGFENGKKGGRDIDVIISDYISECLSIHATNYKDKAALTNLSSSIKEHLSYFDEYDENPIICSRMFKNRLTVEQFNMMIKKSGFMSDIFDSIFDVMDRNDLMPNDIDDIILSGGTSNIPFIKEETEKFFNKSISMPGEADKETKTFEGEGAGRYCGMIKNNDLNISVIHRNIYDVRIKCGDEDKCVLPKGTEYNKFSDIFFFRLSDENKNTLCIYCENGFKQYIRFSENGFIGVRIGTDKDGELMYRFTDASEKVISEGILGGR